MRDNGAGFDMVGYLYHALSLNADIEVPTVNTYDELRHILEGSETFTPQEIEGILGGIYSIDDDKKIGVGIKKILLGIETAKQDIDKAGRFVNVINRLIDQDRGPAFS